MVVWTNQTAAKVLTVWTEVLSPVRNIRFSTLLATLASVTIHYSTYYKSSLYHKRFLAWRAVCIIASATFTTSVAHHMISCYRAALTEASRLEQSAINVPLAFCLIFFLSLISVSVITCLKRLQIFPCPSQPEGLRNSRQSSLRLRGFTLSRTGSAGEVILGLKVHLKNEEHLNRLLRTWFDIWQIHLFNGFWLLQMSLVLLFFGGHPGVQCVNLNVCTPECSC